MQNAFGLFLTGLFWRKADFSCSSVLMVYSDHPHWVNGQNSLSTSNVFLDSSSTALDGSNTMAGGQSLSSYHLFYRRLNTKARRRSYWLALECTRQQVQ